VVYIARDLIRRGLEETATTAYRVGQSQALRYFVGKAFEFTDDPVLLRELLGTVAWSRIPSRLDRRQATMVT
jgi:hypothetical protein